MSTDTSIVTWTDRAGNARTTRLFSAHVAPFIADIVRSGGTVTGTHAEDSPIIREARGWLWDCGTVPRATAYAMPAADVIRLVNATCDGGWPAFTEACADLTEAGQS